MRIYLNLLVVFFLCGLWHGASWAFVAWGLWHGIFLVLERTRFGRWVDAWPIWVARIYTLVVVLVGWVLFRTNHLGSAAVFLKTMAGLGHGSASLAPYMNSKLAIVLALGVLGSTPFISDLLHALAVRRENGNFGIAWQMGQMMVFACLIGILLLSTVLLSNATYNPFIYFRF